MKSEDMTMINRISKRRVRVITLDGRHLRFDDVRAILRQRVRLAIAPAAIRSLENSRAIVDQALENGKVVYGANTGFGKPSNTIVHPDHLEKLQDNLLLSHNTSLGEVIQETGLVIALRANSLLSGYSGVTPALVRLLASMYNRRDYPSLRSQGSVGASGDLAPMADLGCAMLRAKNPYRFRPKEALALINGTSFSAAMLGRCLVDAEELLKLADLAGAMTLEVLQGSIEPFDIRLHEEVGIHPGQKASARNVRTLVQASEILRRMPHRPELQDPYALRCIPQVHGAVRDAFLYAKEVFLREINSPTDNQLVFRNGDILSGGNFHGQSLAIAGDVLALALVSIANISERRIERLGNFGLNPVPPFLVADSGLNSGFMMVQVATAALTAECRVDASPASIHSIPTVGDREDHVPMSPVAIRKCQRILGNVRKVVAMEILCAAQGLDFYTRSLPHKTRLRPGKGSRVAHQFIRKAIPFVDRDRDLRPILDKAISPDFIERLLSEVERVRGILL